MLFAAFSVPAFAAEDAPQPLTRAACDQAGMKWKDHANVCGDKKVHDKEKKAKKKEHHGNEDQPLAERPPQPLTRAACAEAGMKWSDRANACGVKDNHDKKKKAKKKMKHEKKQGKKKHGDGAKQDGQGAKDKGDFKWPWEKKTKDGS